jgi:hypothetical protein
MVDGIHVFQQTAERNTTFTHHSNKFQQVWGRAITHVESRSAITCTACHFREPFDV